MEVDYKAIGKIQTGLNGGLDWIITVEAVRAGFILDIFWR